MKTHPSVSAAAWKLAVVLSAVSCTSCSGEPALNSVKGKVLYQNQPIQGVVVSFHPKGASLETLLPVGQTKEDGTFTLTTGKAEGAPAGEYFVTFTCPQRPETSDGEKGPQMGKFSLEDRFKGAYAQEANAVKVEIKKGNNELEPFSLP